MTAPTTRFSYTDCYDLLERAKEDPQGIRVLLGSLAEARTLRSRIHYARQVDRNDNMTIYAPEDPLFGRSVYDPFVVRIKEDDEGVWIYIQHTSIDKLKVENLSEVQEPTAYEATQKSIEMTMRPDSVQSVGFEFKRRA